MTTATENPTTNTLTLAELLNEHDQEDASILAAIDPSDESQFMQHDEYMYENGSERTYTDVNGIYNRSTQNSARFPSIYKARETVEWQDNYEYFIQVLPCFAAETGDSLDKVRNNLAFMLLNDITDDMSAVRSIDDYMAENLGKYVVCFWALFDAHFALTGVDWKAMNDKQIMKMKPFFSDVYSIGGRIFGSEMWDFMFEAYCSAQVEQLKEQKAKKPQSKASKRKAESEARRQENRKKNGRK